MGPLPGGRTVSVDHHHPRELAPVEQRVAAIEALLVERGYITREAIDAFVRRYEDDIGPMNGARVVARAWTDPAFKERLLADGSAAIAELGYGGPEGGHVGVLEKTTALHNIV